VADWSELYLDGCSLKGTDFGEDPERTLIINGRSARGAELVEVLREQGALGRGVREVEEPTEEDPAPELLREVFAKVVEGSRRDNTRLAKRRFDTFERGRFCQPNRHVVRENLLPLLLSKEFFVKSDLGVAVAANRNRLGEIIDYLFESKLSPGVEDVLKELRRVL